MNSEDGQVYSVWILQFSCFTKYNRLQSKHKQTKCEHSRRNSQSAAFSVGITILNQRIIWKDDIEFVTEFPYFLGHPVHTGCSSKFICLSLFNSYPLALKRVLIIWNSDWSNLIKYFGNNSTLHSSTLLLLNSTYWKMQNMKTTFSF